MVVVSATLSPDVSISRRQIPLGLEGQSAGDPLSVRYERQGTNVRAERSVDSRDRQVSGPGRRNTERPSFSGLRCPRVRSLHRPPSFLIYLRRGRHKVVVDTLEDKYLSRENVFENIAKAFENQRDPASWHQELLRRMLLDLSPLVRPSSTSMPMRSSTR